MLDHRIDVLERRIDLAAEQIGDGRRAALVGNVHAIGAGLLPEQHGREVVGRAIARRGKAHLAGLGLEACDQVGQGLVGGCRGHDQQVGRLHGHAQQVEVLAGVIGNALHQVGRDDQGAQRGDQQRVAVGRAAFDLPRTDGAGRAGLVLDHDALTQRGLHLRGQRPRQRVGRSARRKRNHHVDRLVRPGQGGQGQRETGQQRESASQHRCLL
ncbi:hypothetical protein D3C78_1343360 [compost metagenome]